MGTPGIGSRNNCPVPVDKRTDIWAFGAALYEMLAGKPAFSAETAIQILEVISAAALDWDALPRSTPTRIRKLLRRCLEGDRKQRLLGYRPSPVRDRPAGGRSQLDHIALRGRGYCRSQLASPSVRSAGGAPRSRSASSLRPPPPLSAVIYVTGNWTPYDGDWVCFCRRAR